MAIALVLERHEQIAGDQRTGIDRDACHLPLPCRPSAGGVRRLGGCPERAHARSSFQRRDRDARLFGIIERQDGIADDLPAFVALARDQQRIAGLERVDRTQDRLGPVANFCCIGAGGHDLGTDRCRVLGTGVVVGDRRTISACSAAAAPIRGRLPRSRSPPAPKTTASRPITCGRIALSAVASASGVWA